MLVPAPASHAPAMTDTWLVFNATTSRFIALMFSIEEFFSHVFGAGVFSTQTISPRCTTKCGLRPLLEIITDPCFVSDTCIDMLIFLSLSGTRIET